MKFHSLTFAFLLVITACVPSEKAIQDRATTTLMVPTYTPAATLTFIPSPIPTLTPTATPDLRIIVLDSKNFLLSLEDLPSEGLYFLHIQDTGVVSNQDIKAYFGAQGQELIDETNPIEGWWVNYSRGANKFAGPLNLYNGVEKFQSSQGAEIYLQKYFEKYLTDHKNVIISDTPQIGDFSFESKYESDAIPGYIDYIVAFAYRNYEEALDGYGRESVVSPDFLRNLAGILLERLKAEPLSVPTP